MKTTWRKILGFSRFVGGFQANGNQFPGWLALHPEESKFSYAIKRVVDQITALDKIKVVEFENIDIDNCATDANGVILRNPDGSLAFTKDGLKACNAARSALLDSEVEIEPYYATEVPELLEGEREIFAGFVIKPEEDAPITDSANTSPSTQDAVN